MIFLLAFALLAAFATAQVGTILDPAQLPKCAFSCQTLLSAQSLCVPPIAPVQNQAIYQTCFCNSNYLVNYKAGAVSPTCDDACTTGTDRKAIQQWFVKLCSNGAVVTPQGNAANTLATQTGTATAAATNASSTSKQSGSNNPGTKSWISTHYQWVILVIILIFAAIGASVLGVWLKRRHERKWATGGHPRDTMLQTQDIANSLSNPHPVPAGGAMSQVRKPDYEATPYLNGSREQLAMSGANVKRPGSVRVSSVPE